MNTFKKCSVCGGKSYSVCGACYGYKRGLVAYLRYCFRSIDWKENIKLVLFLSLIVLVAILSI